jgi:predicted helicase
MNLKIHLNYEHGKKYDLGKPINEKFGKLIKLSFGRKTVKGKRVNNYSEIWINGVLVFDNIPQINYFVNGRSPLEWVVDRYKIRVDKDSGIVNEPVNVDIISTIERAVYVGVESDKIIMELPKEFEPKDMKPRKTGLEKFS